nr:hypothetical protein [Tanacetum cinerariifolium]
FRLGAKDQCHDDVGNKMHKAFPLPVMEFPLPEEVPTASEESSHCQKKRYATTVKIALLLKSKRNCQSKSYDSFAKDSYEVPANAATTGKASDGTGKKKGKTVTVTADDMQKRKNDVKATKNTKKNLLKQQYGNFKAEGLETLELTFNRLQCGSRMAYAHDSMKKQEGNEEVNTASVSTASTNVPTASANIGVVTISQDTDFAYIASQSSGSQIKFEDINQIDEDDMEEIDIKWNMALLSMRADRFWKKTGKKISIQGTDVAGFDKLKVECFNCHKMGHFARECRSPRSQDRGRRDNYIQGSKVEEQDPKALMAIDGLTTTRMIDGSPYDKIVMVIEDLDLEPKINAMMMLGIKCIRHSHCQLWSSHCQKKFPLPVKKVPTARRKDMPLL